MIDFEAQYTTIRQEFRDLDQTQFKRIESSINGDWTTFELFKEGLVRFGRLNCRKWRQTVKNAL